MQRLIIIFCLLVPMQLSAQSYFAKHVNLSFRQAPLQAVLNTISKQTGIVFSFDPAKVNVQRKITVEVKDLSAEEALSRLFNGHNLAYEQKGKFAILRTEIPNQATSYGAEPVKMKAALSDLVVNTPRELYVYHPIEPLKNTKIASIPATAKTNPKLARKQSTVLREEIALLLAGLNASQISAQISDEVHRPATVKVEKPRFCVESPVAQPAQLTFINPLGTDWMATKNNTYVLSLNMLGGVTAGVSGVEFGGLYNINRGEMSGVQFAGLLNTNTCSVSGLQFAGLFNYARHGNPQLQVAGLYNRSEKGAKAQLAGIANQAPDGTANVQIAGIFNTVDSMSTQISLVNVAHRGGFQAGLVNIRDTADGMMLGLLNIAKKGGLIEVELAGGFAQLLESTISLRTGIQKFYSILSVGHSFNRTSSPEFWGVGAGFGTSFKIDERWKMNLEAVTFSLADKHFKFDFTKEDDDEGTFNSLLQVRPIVTYQVAKHFKVFAGPSFNVLVSTNSDDNLLRMDAPYTIFKSDGSKNKVQGWIGIAAGVRF